MPKAALTQCVIGNIFHSDINPQCSTCSLSKARIAHLQLNILTFEEKLLFKNKIKNYS